MQEVSIASIALVREEKQVEVHKNDRSDEVRFDRGDAEPGIVKAMVLLHCNGAARASTQSMLDGSG